VFSIAYIRMLRENYFITVTITFAQLKQQERCRILRRAVEANASNFSPTFYEKHGAFVLGY